MILHWCFFFFSFLHTAFLPPIFLLWLLKSEIKKCGGSIQERMTAPAARPSPPQPPTSPTPHQKKKSMKLVGLYLYLYGMHFPKETGLGICLVFHQLKGHHYFLEEVLEIPQHATSYFWRKDCLWILLSRRIKYWINSLSVFWKPFEHRSNATEDAGWSELEILSHDWFCSSFRVWQGQLWKLGTLGVRFRFQVAHLPVLKKKKHRNPAM